MKLKPMRAKSAKSGGSAARERGRAVEGDPRWSAICARDAGADELFRYGVRTTGVYCRPSCASRRPNPENVSFFETSALARGAGFRACARCQPDAEAPRQARAQLVARACRRIDAARAPLELAALAREVGLSAQHFQRVFRAHTGLTPRAWATAARGERVRAQLAVRASVTEALHAAGFGSSGRFYEAAPRLVGMRPRQYQRGGAAARIEYATGTSSLGSVLAARSERGVCAIALGSSARALERELRAQFPRAELAPAGRAFARAFARVLQLVEDPQKGLELPLDVRGTAFQRRVWQALSALPAGTTASYAELAQRIGAPRGARAVARACAANPLAIAIPCHRALAQDGSLAGYRWGLARKRALLRREARAAEARRG
jgi:AraC family transcriptional regulator of adaptative response/methylated-DNA-[protein]-cysteine methyltransferase